MIKIKKGITLQKDAYVLEEGEKELFLQFQKFYKDFQSGVFVEKTAKEMSTDFIQTQSTPVGDCDV